MGSIIPYTNLNNLLFRGLFKIRPFFGTCELSLCKEGAELERFGPAWMHQSPRRSSSQTNKEGNHETIDPHSIGSTDSCPNYESWVKNTTTMTPNVWSQQYPVFSLLHAALDIQIYEGCSKFFHLENAIFAKKKLLSPNFRELHVFLSRYMLAKIFKKNMDVWYPPIVPGVWSLVTLHSAAAALKHLRSALRCWSLLTFIGQFWHNHSLGHLAFKWRSSFAKALAKLSPNFREKSLNSFYKMIHIINNKYIFTMQN